MSTIRTVGLIGLGIMGKPMARNLLRAGFELTVYNRSRGPVDELVADGARAASSVADCARGVDAVLTMLPDGPDSESVVLGEDGVLSAVRPGSLVIDMSSVAPSVSQRIARACEAKGVAFLDAPVSGGETGAVEGTLAIMVGGKKDAFERAKPVFAAVGKSFVLCGDYGAGNTTKLANQIIVAANIEAVGEALVLARKAGLDPRVVLEAIRGGLAGSRVLDTKGPMMIEGRFEPGFRVRLHQKDLHNALLTGKEIGVALPVTALVQQMIGSLVARGRGDEDHAAIARVVEELAGVTIAEG